MEQQTKIRNCIEIKNKIFAYKEKLKQTDYQAIKYAEGELSSEEYSQTKENRKLWREEINKLEEQLKSIKGE